MRAREMIAASAGVFVAALGLWACPSTAPSAPTWDAASNDAPDSASDAGPESSPSDAGPDGAGCPQDLPATCPAAVPSYSGDIVSILERRCFACHTDGGPAAAKHDFSTYANVYAQRSPMLNQVYACLMPPPDAAPPTPAERAALLAWFVCGSPDN